MELLHIRHSLRASNKQLLGGMLLLHKSKYFLTENNPNLLPILGNIFIISKLTKIEFHGKSKEFKLSIISNMSFLSLIIDGKNFCKNFLIADSKFRYTVTGNT